jgi:hypothetical protein
MFDFWVVTGRICLDENFFNDLFARAARADDFINLAEMRKALKQEKLRLSRWEVMELHRLMITKEVVPSSKIGGIAEKTPFASAADNHLVTGVRTAAAAFAAVLRTNLDLLAIVGLCCMDDPFRKKLISLSRRDPEDTAALGQFLIEADESPGFDLNTDHLVILNGLLQSPGVEEALADFQRSRWVIGYVHKHFGACCPGYSGKDYKHLSSQEVAQLLEVQEKESKEDKDVEPSHFAGGGTLKQQLINAKAIV